MDVFGTAMRNANLQGFQNPSWIFGSQSWKQIRKGIYSINDSYEIWGGAFWLCGNVK
jgi:hypothetical protein